jgi:hypothetical protein
MLHPPERGQRGARLSMSTVSATCFGVQAPISRAFSTPDTGPTCGPTKRSQNWIRRQPRAPRNGRGRAGPPARGRAQPGRRGGRGGRARSRRWSRYPGSRRAPPRSSARPRAGRVSLRPRRPTSAAGRAAAGCMPRIMPAPAASQACLQKGAQARLVAPAARLARVGRQRRGGRVALRPPRLDDRHRLPAHRDRVLKLVRQQPVRQPRVALRARAALSRPPTQASMSQSCATRAGAQQAASLSLTWFAPAPSTPIRRTHSAPGAAAGGGRARRGASSGASAAGPAPARAAAAAGRLLCSGRGSSAGARRGVLGRSGLGGDAGGLPGRGLALHGVGIALQRDGGRVGGRGARPCRQQHRGRCQQLPPAGRERACSGTGLPVATRPSAVLDGPP